MLKDYNTDYDVILVNGDSYSEKPMHTKVYSNFLQDSLGVPVINIAASGSNNQRIVRSTIEELSNIRQQYKKPLVLIGWSFIRRMEVWYYGNNPVILNRTPDTKNLEEHLKPRLVTLELLLQHNEATLEQKCLINEDMFVHKQLVDFYTNLFMLANTLKSMSVDYFFFSAAKNTEIPVQSFPYIDNLSQVKWCQQNKNIYKLHDFCMSNWAKENDPACDATGHLSPAGHEKFSKLLIEMLKEISC